MANRRSQARKTLVRDARAVAVSCPGLQIRLAARRITRCLEAGLKPAGLTLAQFGLMAQVAAARDDTIGALAENLDLDQSTLSRNLQSLERAGLVEIAVVEKDLRKRAVWLTETGARRLEAALPLWRTACAALPDSVDSNEIVSIASMIERSRTAFG